MIIRPRFAFAQDQGGAGGGTRTDGQTEGGKTTPDGKDGDAGKAQQDKAGQGSKTTDSDLPSDPAELKALLAKERADRAHLLSVHTEMKTKAEQRELAEAKAREEDLRKQGQFQKLLEEMTPKFEAVSAQSKRQEAALNLYLEAEMKGVPEGFKALIPEGDAASKLEWIARAKASGAFGQTPAVPKGKTPDGTPPPGSSGKVMTHEEFVKLPAKDRSAFMKAGGTIS